VPLSVWDSFFIPMRLRDAVRGVTVPNGAGGARVPLVASERTIEPYPGTPHVVELTTAPRLAWRLLVVGLVLAALVAGIRVMAVSRRGAVWGLAVVTAAWSLLCGLVGVILVLAWTATRHVFWAWNENLFLVSPLSLILVVLLPMALLRRRGERTARGVALAVVALSLVGLVFALVPGGQENRAIVALFLPVHLVIAWSVLRPALAAPRAARGPVVDSRAA
jgi:cytochrome bd-type quinol oxidase subunit 2